MKKYLSFAALAILFLSYQNFSSFDPDGQSRRSKKSILHSVEIHPEKLRKLQPWVPSGQYRVMSVDDRSQELCDEGREPWALLVKTGDVDPLSMEVTDDSGNPVLEFQNERPPMASAECETGVASQGFKFCLPLESDSYSYKLELTSFSGQKYKTTIVRGAGCEKLPQMVNLEPYLKEVF